jgi:hypothetical protein
MAARLTEALLKRASQWKAFHEWERNRTVVVLSFAERVEWYAAAYDFSRSLPGLPSSTNKDEKIARVQSLHTRLKYLNESIQDG